MNGPPDCQGKSTNPRKDDDLDELKLMQKTNFPDFQVTVISTQNDYGPIAQVPKNFFDGMKIIHLLHDPDHYDLITSMAGFYMVSYYCCACGGTYDHKEQHNCGGVCQMCYRFNEECLPLDVQLCQDCGRNLSKSSMFCHAQTNSTQRNNILRSTLRL